MGQWTELSQGHQKWVVFSVPVPVPSHITAKASHYFRPLAAAASRSCHARADIALLYCKDTPRQRYAPTTSNEHEGTVLWVTRVLLSRPVAQNIVLHLHLLEWFFLPCTLMDMEMAGYPFFFFSDSIWTPQESDKMHQNSAIRPKIECPWRNWAQNLDRAFSFSSILEWNDKKCQIFTKFQHFLTLT